MKKKRRSRNNVPFAALVVTLAVTVILITGGCSESAPTLSPPATTMVQYVDDPFATTGIRPTPAAVADSGSVGGLMIEWNAVDQRKATGITVGGYYLYRSRNNTESELKNKPTFVRIQKIPITPAKNDTFFIDKDIQVGYIYSYYVTSYNNSDNSQESVSSDTVHFSPTTRPIPTEPRGTIPMPADGKVRFHFEPADQIGGPNVGIEVNEVSLVNENILIRQVWRSLDETPQFGTGYIDYNGDLPLTPGRYRWRIFSSYPLFVGADSLIIPYGNTSKWETFILQ